VNNLATLMLDNDKFDKAFEKGATEEGLARG
jgi:hypothetical protein